MDPWLRHHLLVLSEHVISNTEVVFGAWIPPNTCWRHLCWMWHKKKPKSKITYGFGVYCHLDSYRFQLSYFHMCALLAGWAVWEGRLLTFLGLRFLRCPIVQSGGLDKQILCISPWKCYTWKQQWHSRELYQNRLRRAVCMSMNVPWGDAVVLSEITSFQIFIPGWSFQPAH